MARLKDKDGTPVWKWNKKSSGVNIANLNPNIISYIDTLPVSVQNKILATSGNDSGHSKTSRHYNNSAVDLRFDDEVWKYIEKDPNRLKFGLTLLDPNHGSAKHIHLSHGEGSENKSDVWMDPYSYNAKDVVTVQNVPQSSQVLEQNYQRDNQLQKIQEEIDRDSEIYQQQQQAILYEQAQQQQARDKIQERNSILDAIGSNNLEFEGRNYRPTDGFAKGGEITENLDDDIDFMINSLKSADTVTDSPEYLSLLNENQATKQRLEENYNLYNSVLKTEVKDTPAEDNLNNQSAVNPPIQNISNLSNVDSTKNLIYSELNNLGLNSTQIAGVIGSLGGESTENLSSTATNPTSKAFGIAQWLGPRYRNLIKFSSDNGLDYKTPEAQAKFLAHELKTTHKGVLKQMLNTKDLSSATEVWTRKFEIPSEKEIRQSMSRRIKFAQNFMKSIT